MSDYQVARSISDIQSKIAIIDDAIANLSAGSRAAQPGRKLVLQVAAQVSRMVGNERRADGFEKATTAP
jgi:hypothetical protein